VGAAAGRICSETAVTAALLASHNGAHLERPEDHGGSPTSTGVCGALAAIMAGMGGCRRTEATPRIRRGRRPDPVRPRRNCSRRRRIHRARRPDGMRRRLHGSSRWRVRLRRPRKPWSPRRKPRGRRRIHRGRLPGGSMGAMELAGRRLRVLLAGSTPPPDCQGACSTPSRSTPSARWRAPRT
jgi:hypothetical protein